MGLKIESSNLQGTIAIPSSKSHTLRAILFASIAEGTSYIYQYLDSPDTDAMINALKMFGAKISKYPSFLKIQGCNGNLKSPDNVIDCGNSGLVLRLVGALASLVNTYCIFTGDHSIRYNRAVSPLLKGLTDVGVFAVSCSLNNTAPILIKGPILGSKIQIDGQDSQPVSGLLIASCLAPHPIEIFVDNPGEKPWIDMTLHWLKKFSVQFDFEDYHYYRIPGNISFKAFSYHVPGDFSSLAFPVVAALATNSEITLENVDLDDVQGDKVLLSILESMGAKFLIEKEAKRLTVCKNCKLIGRAIDVNHCIDALPILAVVGTFASGSTYLYNGLIARKKESDRIFSIANELRKMGANITEHADGLTIENSNLYGAKVFSYNDHRLAMSLAVAGVRSLGETVVENISCINKTYPTFLSDFLSLGAKFSSVDNL